MSDKLFKRSEVDPGLKWDLTSLFQTEADFDLALEELVKDVDQFVQKYQGKLKNEEDVLTSVKDLEAIVARLQDIHQYSYLPVSVDITDSLAKDRSQKTSSIVAQVSTKPVSYTHLTLPTSDLV